jgi:hypothetical protein
MIEEVIKTCSYALHVVVLLLAEALDEVLDEDDLFATGELVEIVTEVEDLAFCYCSAFLDRGGGTMMMMLLKRIFLHFEPKR